MVQNELTLGGDLFVYVVFAVGLLAIFVNVFAKSAALSVAVVIINVAVVILAAMGEMTVIDNIIQIASICLIIAGCIGAWKYGTK